MEESTNIAAQIEEVEALSAIYADDWVVDSEAERRYVIIIEKDVQLRVRLPDDYPSLSPPYFELDALQLTGADRQTITDRLNSLYSESAGQPMLYTWAEDIKDFLSKLRGDDQPEISYEPLTSEEEAADATAEEFCPEIFHDEPFTDRKSTFQAHTAAVTDVEQVAAVMRKLLSNKKIASATHNIQAYRIQLSNGSFTEDQDEDGETGAGNRLLHLLNIVGAVNVVVVVSRWFGGVLLHNDRFKHINNCARNALQKQDFIQSSLKKGSAKKGEAKRN